MRRAARVSPLLWRFWYGRGASGANPPRFAVGTATMKVAILNEKYHPHVSGGAEKSVKILVDALAGRGAEPEVVTSSPDPAGRTDRVDGIRVHYLAARNFFWPFDGKERGRWKMWLYHARDAVNLPMAGAVARALDGMGADLVHTNNLSGLGLLAWRAAKARSLPVVHTLRDHFLMCPFSARYRNGRICGRTCPGCVPFALGARRLSRSVDAVVGNSRDILDRHLRAGYFAPAARRAVVYNASRIRAADGAAEPRPDVVTLAFLGRVAPEKGIESLLESTRRLPLGGWALLIAGDGKDAYVSHLKSRFDAPGIRWLGWVEPRRVYRDADWVVVPSLWHEPLPRVILEAHACGVPVVASDRGGNPEVVRHGETGLLYDPGEAGALASALARAVAGEPSAAVLAGACRAAGAQFRPDRLAERYLEIYRQALADARRPT